MEPYVGQLMLFAASFAPRGWAACDGQLLSIAQNQVLFSIIGTTYGGDGVRTFALPDLRGCVATQCGQGDKLTNVAYGQSYGVSGNVLTAGQMPEHTHAASGTVSIEVNPGDDEESETPVGAYLRKQSKNTYATTANASMGAVPVSLNVANAGLNQPANNTQPSLVMMYCIALSGVYPSRN